MARPHVPKLGNWEDKDNAAYPDYVEKASEGRKGEKIINPNDPEENPGLYSGKASQANQPIRQSPARPMHVHNRSRESIELKQFADSPYHYNAGRRALSNDLTEQQPSSVRRASGENYRRPTRSSAGSENSFEQSPLHMKGKVPGRVMGAPSPSHDGKSSHGSSYGTPGRTRMKQSSRANDSPDTGAAVPRFGEWNESNPESGDGYTEIFNKVREQKQTEGRTWAGTEGRGGASPYKYSVQRQASDDGYKICCFPWCRK